MTPDPTTLRKLAAVDPCEWSIEPTDDGYYDVCTAHGGVVVGGLTRRYAELIAESKNALPGLIDDLAERNAQLDATRNVIAAECVEHVELNGHIDLAEQCRDWIAHDLALAGDPSGRLDEFIKALRVVIDQCDRQRRRANWYEAAYTAGKQKLIESAVNRALARARAAAQVYAERVEALGLAADDNDPRVMATAEPIGAAQADLYAALGLLERSETGEVVVTPPAESVEQLRAERDAARMLADVRGRERDELRIDRDSYANSQFERQIDELHVALGKAERERDELRAAHTRLLVLVDQAADCMHLSGNEKLAEKLRGKAGLPLATKDDAK